MNTISYSRTVPVIATPDVLVAGGGLAGICAAASAAEHGARTLLIEQFAELGGAATISGVSGFCGHTRGVGRPFDEIVEKLAEFEAIAPYNPEQDARAIETIEAAFVFQEFVLAKGVNVLLHARVADAVRDESGRITSALVATTEGLGAIVPRYVIDATGDADVVHTAGFPTVSGSEDGEPELPMSLYFSLWETGEKQTPWLPPGCPTYTAETIPMTSIHRRAGGRWDVKMKVIGHRASIARELSDAEIEARRQMFGLVYFLQTVGYNGRVFDMHRLSSVSPQIGIREGRRIVGEYVLTTDDVRSGRRFPDAVAVGTYHIDFHWPMILQRAGTGITDPVPTYQIPLRMLIPKGSTNALVAGRCASGEQLAMSSFRVMTTAAAMGHAAGICATLACGSGRSPGEVDVASLQREIEAAGGVLDSDWHMVYQAERRAKGKKV